MKTTTKERPDKPHNTFSCAGTPGERRRCRAEPATTVRPSTEPQRGVPLPRAPPWLEDPIHFVFGKNDQPAIIMSTGVAQTRRRRVWVFGSVVSRPVVFRVVLLGSVELRLVGMDACIAHAEARGVPARDYGHHSMGPARDYA